MHISNKYIVKEFHGITVNTTLPSNSSNYYSLDGRDVKYIVMHYTGNSSDTARANANYFNTGSRSASAHYFVDNDSCYQSVALNNAAWAVGGTSSYKHSECRNKNSISIEMCCSGNYRISEKTEINAAHLCAALCRVLGIGADNVDKYVLRHWDVWDKDCPSYWTGINNARWSGFKNRVKRLLKNESEGLTMTQYEELKSRIAAVESENDKLKSTLQGIKSTVSERLGYYNYIDSNMNSAYRPTIQKLVGNDLLQGNENGELMLTNDMMRTLTIIDRTGVFG